jgi:hypothetical protein
MNRDVFLEAREVLGDIFMEDLARIPEHMKYSVLRYVLRGERQGHFLAALFSNDFVDIFRRADETNIRFMKIWAEFLHNAMPILPVRSYGSQKYYEAWIEQGGVLGREKKEG